MIQESGLANGKRSKWGGQGTTGGSGCKWKARSGGEEAQGATSASPGAVQVAAGLLSGLLLAGSLLGTAVVQAAEFIPLGFLPGGDQSWANGVSADGSVVVGESNNRAFRWQNGTMTNLGVLPGGTWSWANGVSADGLVVVGGSYTTTGWKGAFRWTETTGINSLGTLPGGAFSEAYGVSADGSVVVGESGNPIAGSDHAFRWTTTGGMSSVGGLSGFQTWRALGVSADGSVVVGWGYSSSTGLGAFRWENGTMTLLGGLPGANPSAEALGVSADGLVVVGKAVNAEGLARAFRWTAIDGMTDLGTLPGGSSTSYAFGVSADGSVVVGQSMGEAAIWDQTHGMRSLLDVLITDYGLGSQLNGWSLVKATAISPNGRYIVGMGYNPNHQVEGWLVRLDAAPVPLPAVVYLFGAGLASLAGLARWRAGEHSGRSSPAGQFASRLKRQSG